MHVLFLLIWLGLCAIQDSAQRRISNWLTLGGLALCSLYLAWTGESVIGASPLAALSAMGLSVLLTLPGYVLKRLGAGDVKLFAALGLATNVEYLLYCLGFSSAAQVLCYLFLRRRAKTTRNTHMAFAPFIFFGFLLSALLLMH